MPFPVVQLDTEMKLPEVYAFRDEIAAQWNLDLRIVASYLGTILRDGAFTFVDRWVYAFEFARPVSPFAVAFGSDAVIIRPYRERGPTAT